jgi:hypothetical protein
MAWCHHWLSAGSAWHGLRLLVAYLGPLLLLFLGILLPAILLLLLQRAIAAASTLLRTD